ncbi:MAG: AI-2E family transporter [Candidatus Peribacteraceae bacterium]|nr:AI-2E family transporter [Candidatus Peribacteraceae bacterium]
MARSRSSDGTPFTSLRIIGEKAQKLLAKAKEMSRKKGRKEDIALRPAPPPALPEVTVHLSLGGIVRAAFILLAIVAGVRLLLLLQDKIVLLLLAVFVAAVLDPGVKALQRLRVPRGVSVLLLYFVALFLFIFLLVSLIPILAGQIQQIAVFLNGRINAFLSAPSVNLPLLTPDVNLRLTDLLASTLQGLSIQQFTDALQAFGQSLAVPAEGSLFFAARVAGSVLNFFLNLVVVLVLAFFLQLEKEKVLAWIRSFLPRSFRGYVDDKSEMIRWKLAQWMRGQLLLCLAVSILVFLALVILRMPYALTLAVLAGFMEFLPVIGIFAAAVPAVIIAFTQQGFFWALMLACIYYVVQWCESNLLAPLILRRTVDLSPIAILFAMLVGISFPGIIHPVLGIMLAIPLTTIIALFLEDWMETRGPGR